MSSPVMGMAGAGLMGTGIGFVCARSGWSVRWYDPSEAALDRSRAMIQKLLAKESGTLPADLAPRMSWSSAMEDLAGVEGVIEAASEDGTLKKRLLADLETRIPERAWLATNTSSLRISDLSGALARPQRLAGLHFFNPAEVMPLVELVAGPCTAPGILETLENLVSRLGKVPVRVSDQPGFVVNRLLFRMIGEAVRALDEGVASVAVVDQAMMLGANHPVGPLGLADRIGLDVCLHILESLATAWPDRDWGPPPLLHALVAQGDLGRKSGRGFYDHSSRPASPRADLPVSENPGSGGTNPLRGW